MKRLVRNTALLLMLAAGALTLPCVAQQEVMPDIYDATPRSSAPVAKRTTKPATSATVRPAAHRQRAKRTSPKPAPVMLAKAHPKSAVGK